MLHKLAYQDLHGRVVFADKIFAAFGDFQNYDFSVRGQFGAQNKSAFYQPFDDSSYLIGGRVDFFRNVLHFYRRVFVHNRQNLVVGYVLFCFVGGFSHENGQNQAGVEQSGFCVDLLFKLSAQSEKIVFSFFFGGQRLFFKRRKYIVVNICKVKQLFLRKRSAQQLVKSNVAGVLHFVHKFVAALRQPDEICSAVVILLIAFNEVVLFELRNKQAKIGQSESHGLGKLAYTDISRVVYGLQNAVFEVVENGGHVEKGFVAV